MTPIVALPSGRRRGAGHVARHRAFGRRSVSASRPGLATVPPVCFGPAAPVLCSHRGDVVRPAVACFAGPTGRGVGHDAEGDHVIGVGRITTSVRLNSGRSTGVGRITTSVRLNPGRSTGFGRITTSVRLSPGRSTGFGRTRAIRVGPPLPGRASASASVRDIATQADIGALPARQPISGGVAI